MALLDVDSTAVDAEEESEDPESEEDLGAVDHHADLDAEVQADVWAVVDREVVSAVVEDPVDASLVEVQADAVEDPDYADHPDSDVQDQVGAVDVAVAPEDASEVAADQEDVSDAEDPEDAAVEDLVDVSVQVVDAEHQELDAV